LHMAQLMPLPLTVTCFSKIQIGFTFLVVAHLGSPGKRAVKRCVCVCVLQSDRRTYQGHVEVVRVALWVRRIDSQSDAVGEDRHQNEVLKRSGITQLRQPTEIDPD